MAHGYQPIEVRGSDDYKYTNPGGFIGLRGHHYVAVRRTSAKLDMATAEARGSDIVLLRREGERLLVDVDEVLLRGDPSRGLSYEDPRVLYGAKGMTFTYVHGGRYRTWMMEMRDGQRVGSLFPVGPNYHPAKNGYVYDTEDFGAVVVNRIDERRAIQFYRFNSYREALSACRKDAMVDWWQPYQNRELCVPHWLSGKQGTFRHCGFGTIVHSRLAVLHFARADDLGKYYVTALQPLGPSGMPVGAPEIIAEPAANMPHGDVPNVIYTTMAWIDGRHLVLWSGHDDSSILECRHDLPAWALPR